MSGSAFVESRTSSFDAAPAELSPLLMHVNAIVSQLFRAGLALDSVEHSAESDYAKTRAAVAAAALDQALCELRVLACELDGIDTH